jgi:hypothetical protein
MLAINTVMVRSRERATLDTLSTTLAVVNSGQHRLRDLDPNAGVIRATFYNSRWKAAYYVDARPRLRNIKRTIRALSRGTHLVSAVTYIRSLGRLCACLVARVAFLPAIQTFIASPGTASVHIGIAFSRQNI